MTKSLEKFLRIEMKMKRAFFIMVGVDVIIYITRLVFYATDITIRHFDDLTEIMRSGFLILAFLYVLLLINYMRYFRSSTELKLSRFIKMILFILVYIFISFIVFTVVGLVLLSLL